MANIAHLEGANVYFLLDRDTGRIVGFKDGNNQDQLLETSSEDFSAQITQLANTTNAAIAQAVQSVGNRAGTAQYGNTPASNVAFAGDNMTMEQFRVYVDTRFASVGTNDPSVTTDPSLGGTVGVGNLLTVTRGTVVNGSGGAHLDVLTWYFIAPVTGVVTVVFAETIPSASTPTQFLQQASHIGGTIYVIQQAKDTVTTKLSNAKTTNVKGPVTGTAPTNTGAQPSISGSAVSGSALNVDVGVWTGALNFVVQLYADGVPYKAASAKAATNPVPMGNSDDSVVGKVVTARVTAYSSLDVPSATAVLTSNSITVTGAAPAVVNTAVPVWQATINFGTLANGNTPGTWTGPISATRSYEYYIGVPDGTPDFGPQALFQHTPRAPAVVGNTLYVIERVYDQATGTIEVGNAVSLGKVISAALATFQAQLTTEGAAGYAWTQSQQITQATVATLANGTQPWKLDPTTPFSPVLPAGLTGSISGSSLIITGTPSVSSSSTAYTANFKDSAGSPASASVTFSASVAVAGVTPLARKVPVVWDGLNQGQSWNDANPPTILGPDGQPRVQKNADGTYTFITKNGDPNDFGYNRSEFSWSGVDNIRPANDYWFAFAVKPEIWTTDGGAQGFFQIHQTDDAGESDDGPTLLLYTYLNTLVVSNAWQPTAIATPNQRYPALTGDATCPPTGVYTRFVIHYRPGFLSSHLPRLEIWRNGNQILNDSALNCSNNVAADWNKQGVYKFGPAYGSNNTRQIRQSPIYFGVGTNLKANADASLAGYPIS